MNKSIPEVDSQLVQKLVVANRILAHQGVVDGFGHVSVRHGEVTNAFLLSRSRAPALIAEQDIGCYDLDGEALGAVAGAPYLERFIHSEIYRARPDVMAVVHSHSLSVIPFGVTGQRLRPIFHMAGFLGGGTSLFEIRETAGESDLLIRNGELGRSLASVLGDRACVLMRGHGSTAVGTSLEQAVYRAIYTEVNAKLQTTAMAMGEVCYLTEAEASLTAQANDSQMGRAWELWQKQLATY